MPKWVLSPVWESGFEEGRCRCIGAGPGRRHGGLWTRSRYADDRVGFYGATVGEVQLSPSGRGDGCQSAAPADGGRGTDTARIEGPNV